MVFIILKIYKVKELFHYTVDLYNAYLRDERFEYYRIILYKNHISYIIKLTLKHGQHGHVLETWSCLEHISIKLKIFILHSLG